MPRQTLRLVLAAAFLALPARAPAQEHHHAHDAGEQLGAVHFPTSCRGVDADFTRAVALLHSFGYEESRRAFETVAAKDPACGMASWGIAMTWYHPIWAPPTAEGSGGRSRRGAEGARARRQDGSRARLHRGDRHVLPRLGAPGPQHAGERLQGGDGSAREEVSRRPRGDDLLRARDPGHRARKRSDLRRTEARREAPERPAPARAAAPGHRALHDPRVRLSGAGGGSAPRGPRLREDRALLAPRAPHAVAHLHAARPLAGVDRLEPRVGRGRPPARRAPHPGASSFDALHALGLSRVRVPPDRRHGRRRAAWSSNEAAPARRLDEPNFAAAYALAAMPARYARAPGLERSSSARGPAEDFPWQKYPVRSKRSHLATRDRRRANRRPRDGARGDGQLDAIVARAQSYDRRPRLGRAGRDPAARAASWIACA